MYVWDELKKFAAAGETWIEGVEEHVAVLLARKMDHERRVALEADIAALDAPVAPVPTPEPDAGAVAAGGVAVTGVDANGSPVYEKAPGQGTI